ncbi:hypothetical protein OG896_32075 [Streptomyces sp. NBC_00669]|uniref:hypothetical protein n=1 Tax=Streptomyces sp. NBC_00669 TaxID=2976011 RepID=UPI002E36A89E|nr:hypothetical protein [Streptomyces sp. NBC_00669]
MNGELGKKLDPSRLPTRADRHRAFLGHVKNSLPTNPLAPTRVRRRHPKMLPDGARDKLLAVVNAARDRLVVTWPADGGLRIGELCGLHLVDLHLRENTACGECRAPHVHLCHRPGNPNRAETKTKLPWRIDGGTVTGGLIKQVSPAVVHTYFDYLTCGEYPRETAGHGMLLVQLHGKNSGQSWAPVGTRRMLGRAGKPAGLGIVKPHAFRRNFTSAVPTSPAGKMPTALQKSPKTFSSGSGPPLDFDSPQPDHRRSTRRHRDLGPPAAASRTVPRSPGDRTASSLAPGPGPAHPGRRPARNWLRAGTRHRA